MYLGFRKLQEDALDRHLAAGVEVKAGFLLNAMLTGIVENFQGKILSHLDTGVITYGQVGIDKDLEPYFVEGASQALALRVSDTTAVAAAGIPDNASGTQRGLLRLTLNDTNGAAAMAMTQENVLWIPNTASWSLAFDVAQITNLTLGSAISFTEFGVMGEQSTIADITNAAKEPADGNAFVAFKVYGSKAFLRIRPTASATILTSGAIEIPSTGLMSLRLDFNYNSGNPSFTVYVNGRRALSMASSISGPLQLFARVCHGASYVAATHVPTVFDIDGIAMSIPQ